MKKITVLVKYFVVGKTYFTDAAPHEITLDVPFSTDYNLIIYAAQMLAEYILHRRYNPHDQYTFMSVTWEQKFEWHNMAAYPLI